MRAIRVITSAIIIAAVLCLIAYSTIRYTNKLEREALQTNMPLGHNDVHTQNPYQETSYQIHLSNALDIQVLSDGRQVALLPVDGGSAWFVINQ